MTTNSDSTLSHINQRGDAHMVDVSEKNVTHRSATARSEIKVGVDVIRSILEDTNKKGDVLATARIAGIQAAKKCCDLIPLCHPLPLSKVTIDIDIDEEESRIVITASCKVNDETGVEMEALTAASISALTIYDMCKAIDKGMVISQTRLLEKTGGKSGEWHADTN